MYVDQKVIGHILLFEHSLNSVLDEYLKYGELSAQCFQDICKELTGECCWCLSLKGGAFQYEGRWIAGSLTFNLVSLSLQKFFDIINRYPAFDIRWLSSG